jgi:predicted acyl esterase
MDKEFFEDGYILVQQDIRGLHNSEGEFVMNRPIVGPLNKTGIDESTDAYDAIDWLVKNVPEVERQGWNDRLLLPRLHDARGEINPHPALKAAVPQSPMVDGWMGDDWFHNGAFRVSGFDYAVSQSTGKGGGKRPRVRHGRRLHPVPRGGLDGRLRPPTEHRTLPVRAEADAESGLYRVLVGQAVDKWMAAHGSTVPTLIEVGQWDQEDSYGGPPSTRRSRTNMKAAGCSTW